MLFVVGLIENFFLIIDGDHISKSELAILLSPDHVHVLISQHSKTLDQLSKSFIISMSDHLIKLSNLRLLLKLFFIKVHIIGIVARRCIAIFIEVFILFLFFFFFNFDFFL